MTLSETETKAEAAALSSPPGRPSISVLVPVFNEVESVREMSERVASAVAPIASEFEILFIDDGSTDGTFEAIRDYHRRDRRVRGVRLRRNYGKSAALAVGFREVRGDIVCTIDGDLQDEPAAIPELVERLEAGFDVVSGWKQHRQDRRSKRWSSKLFNWVTGTMSGLRLHDFNCGLKVYRREVTDTIEVYGELHRFLPALAHWEGFRVTEHPVVHHARPYGTSKFGRSRYLNGLLDLVTVMFMHASARSPIHLFGRLGIFSSVVGFAVCAVFIAQWLGGAQMRVRPLMLFGIGLVILGVQFVSLGLLAELIARERSARPVPVRERLE